MSDSITPKKCKYKNCIGRQNGDLELLICSVCENAVFHPGCYEAQAFVSVELKDAPGVCGKRCHNKRVPKANDEETIKRVLWHNDGPDAGTSSQSVLIEWLTTHGNYKRWRGADRYSGVTKKTLASNILEAMKQKGITTDRSVGNVCDKISSIEISFRKAIDWLDGTGAGVTNNESLESYVKRLCPFFYELEPIMKDRASARPLCSTDDLDSVESKEGVEGKEGEEGEDAFPKEISMDNDNSGKSVASEVVPPSQPPSLKKRKAISLQLSASSTSHPFADDRWMVLKRNQMVAKKAHCLSELGYKEREVSV